MEEAFGYRALMEDFSLTQEEAAVESEAALILQYGLR